MPELSIEFERYVFPFPGEEEAQSKGHLPAAALLIESTTLQVLYVHQTPLVKSNSSWFAWSSTLWGRTIWLVLLLPLIGLDFTPPGQG